MATMRLEIMNLPEVRALIAKRPELARAVLDEAVAAAAEVIRELAALKAPGPEIEMSKVGDGVYEVGPSEEKFYYGFFEKGTRPHRVAPVEAKALSWDGDKFSAGHMVGGVMARPFLRPAIDEGKDKAGMAAGEVFKGAIE